MAIKGLKAWVDKLSKVDMPVLANVVRELNELTGSDETGVNQLAEVILKDANLTSQVLRIANSVQYNPSHFPINTVSRAIVLIGFKGVRAICISVMVIDSLLGKEPRDRMLEGMAQAFHSAVQAKNLVKRTNEAVQEEVFIAALLYHLGDLAFWACGGKVADELDTLLKSGELSEREATEKVIGTTFKAITRSLAGVWKLGETLEQALYLPKAPSPKVIAVRLGEEIGRHARHGWDSKEMAEVLHKVAKFSGVNVAQARKMVLEMADDAAAVALTYGAARICHLIPSGKQAVVDQEEEAAPTRILMADSQLQLNIIRELSNALSENLDVNTIFQMVLEGLHRGVGLERVVVAFIQGGRIKARYVLGEGTEKWREKFDFPVSKQHKNIFTEAIATNQPLWLKQKQIQQIKYLYTPEILSLVGFHPAFISNIRLDDRDIAIFYADRWNLGGSLDNDQFASFRHFVVQTQMTLQLLKKK